MIYLCDAIMGAGKSSAAINFMNAHPEKKFLYVTPFNDETTRIQEACPAKHFALPDNKQEEYDHRKREHLRSLVQAGRNVAMTHVLVSLCDQALIDLIRQQQYTMIVDEAIAAMDSIKESADDVETALASEWFQRGENDALDCCEVKASGKAYNGRWMRDLRFYADNHRLVTLDDDEGKPRLYCWMLNADILQAPKDLYVLTYLFNASPMSYLFQICSMEYTPIYVIRDHRGDYQFSLTETYMPAYVIDLPQKIHILHNDKMNLRDPKRGRRQKKNTLSINWSKNAASHLSTGQAERLRRNLDNYFNNIHRGEDCSKRLWTCHKSLKPALRGKGYSSQYLVFNSRATNNYKDANVLAYCINVYMPTWEMRYYEKMGAVVDGDLYALSIMIQWIWRGAIREGNEIWIYVPSDRMRDLLEKWIADVSKKGLALNAGSESA